MFIQELKSNGMKRNVDPIEVTPQFWAKLQKSKVGQKRYKVVKGPKVETKKEKQDPQVEDPINK